MHDYLATDGESSLRPGGEDDSKRHLYSGYRDKSKVCKTNDHIVYRVPSLTVLENVQTVRDGWDDGNES